MMLSSDLHAVPSDPSHRPIILFILSILDSYELIRTGEDYGALLLKLHDMFVDLPKPLKLRLVVALDPAELVSLSFDLILRLL